MYNLVIVWGITTIYRPVASNFSGGVLFEENVNCNNQGSGAAEEFIWYVNCPHS